MQEPFPLAPPSAFASERTSCQQDAPFPTVALHRLAARQIGKWAPCSG
jgi:hypothetical protein